MGVAKVVLNGTTLIDTTGTTVTSDTMVSPATALNKAGNVVTGSIATKSAADLTASGATVTVPAGVYTSAATKSVTTATHPNPTVAITSSTGVISASHTQTAGYVTAGTTNSSLNLTTQAGTTITPTETAQTAVPSYRWTTGNVNVAAISSTYVGSGVPTRTSSDIDVDGSVVTVPSGVYAASTSVDVFGGGGGSQTQEGIKFLTPSTASSSIQFTGLAGEPNSFYLCAQDTLATGASPYKVAAVVFDGTNLIGQTITNTSNAQVTYNDTAFSKSYSNGTLTITSTGPYFQAVEYRLVYTYGTAPSITTKDVQVGSGATSITFTGLPTDDYMCISCIFKSNFSTSSGYQRVIWVVDEHDGATGMEMDSSAKFAGHWTISQSGTSLTITSNGTNQGGYFHQPGYYQLTYVVAQGGGSSSKLQDKNVTPTESQQVVSADGSYLALSTVTVAGISSNYVGTNVIRRSAADLTANLSTVTVAAGYYSSQVAKSITTVETFVPAITLASATGVVTGTNTFTSGYYPASTKTNTLNLTTQAAQTFTPASTSQYISSYRWLTGSQTIKGDPNLVPSNIASGVSIFGVTGTHQGGTDVTTFTLIWDSNYEYGDINHIQSITCNKTYSECYNNIDAYPDANNSAILIDTYGAETYTSGLVFYAIIGTTTGDIIKYVAGVQPYMEINYYSDNTITVSMSPEAAMTLNATENGTYTPMEGVYTQVNVNVVPDFTHTITLLNTGWYGGQGAQYGYISFNNSSYRTKTIVSYSSPTTVRFYLGTDYSTCTLYINGSLISQSQYINYAYSLISYPLYVNFDQTHRQIQAFEDTIPIYMDANEVQY